MKKDAGRGREREADERKPPGPPVCRRTLARWRKPTPNSKEPAVLIYPLILLIHLTTCAPRGRRGAYINHPCKTLSLSVHLVPSVTSTVVNIAKLAFLWPCPKTKIAHTKRFEPNTRYMRILLAQGGAPSQFILNSWKSPSAFGKRKKKKKKTFFFFCTFSRYAIDNIPLTFAATTAAVIKDAGSKLSRFPRKK